MLIIHTHPEHGLAVAGHVAGDIQVEVVREAVVEAVRDVRFLHALREEREDVLLDRRVFLSHAVGVGGAALKADVRRPQQMAAPVLGGEHGSLDAWRAVSALSIS